MRIGDQIICINDTGYTPQALKLIPNRPVVDKIYTVRDVLLTRNGKALHLEEITNPPVEYPGVPGSTFEPSFSVDRFRKLWEETHRVGFHVKEKVEI